MKTSLNVRKQNVLTLAVLALLMAAAVLLTGPVSTANLDGSLSAAQTSNPDGQKQPTPRVRFAPLGGYRGPSALEGRWTPAALDGLRGPGWRNPGWRNPAALTGRKPPSALGEAPVSQATPVTLVDVLVVLALAALLLTPARKASPGIASQARN